MKILIAAEYSLAQIGGQSTYAQHLLEGLLAKGHKLVVVCYGQKLKDLRGRGIKIAGVCDKWPNFLRQFFYFIKLLCVSRGCSFVYALGSVSSGYPALWVKKITGKKLIVRMMTDIARERITNKNWVSTNIDNLQKQVSRGIFKLIKNVQYKVIKQADLVIVHCFYFKKMVCELRAGCGHNHKDDKCANAHVKVIYKAIGPKLITGITRSEAQEKIRVKGDILLTIGRVVPRKGMGMLIRLMPHLLKVNPNFKLLIVGAGSGAFIDFYRVLVKELGLDENIILTGDVPHREIGYYYTAASLFLLNSKQESLPFVILEALQYQLPVISSGVGGVPEIIEDGVNGVLVEYNNQDKWLEAIVELWQDEPLRRCFGACNLTSLGVFDKDRMINETVDAFEAVSLSES